MSENSRKNTFLNIYLQMSTRNGRTAVSEKGEESSSASDLVLDLELQQEDCLSRIRGECIFGVQKLPLLVEYLDHFLYIEN